VALDPNVRVEPDASTRGAYAALSDAFDEKLAQRLSRTS
jgi:hypothetical protein